MLITQLIVRVIIVVVIIDTIAFYLLKRHAKPLTVPYAVGFAAITIIVLLPAHQWGNIEILSPHCKSEGAVEALSFFMHWGGRLGCSQPSYREIITQSANK